MTCSPPPHILRHLLERPFGQEILRLAHAFPQRLDLEFASFDESRNIEIAILAKGLFGRLSEDLSCVGGLDAFGGVLLAWRLDGSRRLLAFLRSGRT